jgi:cytochrome c
MIKSKALAGLVALSALVAACSGGDSDGKEPEKAAVASPTAAPTSVPAGPPAANDVATLDGTSFASMTGNAAAGKLVFAQCRSCHVTDVGVNKTGPSLNGIIGRAAGTVAGFNYSPANKNAGITWSKEKLFQFLEKPQRVVPQTKMIFAGLPDAQKRADLIAYLENPS